MAEVGALSDAAETAEFHAQGRMRALLSGFHDSLVVVDLRHILAIMVDKLYGLSSSHGNVLGANSGAVGAVGQEQPAQSTEDSSESNLYF